MQLKTCETNFIMKPHIRLIISSDLKYTRVYHGLCLLALPTKAKILCSDSS